MSARSLRLISPFRCQFNLNSAKMIESGEEFNTFLDRFNRDFRTARQSLFPKVPQGVDIEAMLHQQKADSKSPRYIELNKAGSLFNSPKYLSISFNSTLHADINKYLQEAAQTADSLCGYVLSDKLSPVWENADIAIYCYTIALFTLDVSIGDKFGNDDWNKVDEWTTHFVFHLLNCLYKDYIFPALCGVNDYADHCSEKRVRSPRDYVVFYDLSNRECNPSSTSTLWVNRTLICPPGNMPDNWGLHNTNTSSVIEVNKTRIHLGWGNNVIETTHTDYARDLSPVWQSMCLAQYYYAVLDVTAKNLKRFVGSTYDKKSNRALRELSQAMDAVVNTVTIFQIEYKDLSMELQGLTKEVFNRLEKTWDFETVFKNVQGKCDLCKSNVERMSADMSQRNNVRVEMVLTTMTGLGFVNLMISISWFGRVLLKEGYQSDIVGLLDVGQKLSPSAMVWIGVWLAILVITFVAANRLR
ncbi:MAG: hypothetical protein V4568_17900 [Pseudomonadota bacterium]